ncbi:polysaccharide biosynthesis/export family protein [Sphingomonas radiodurans]|uniref:polysaccharide biosynthesis/export family protein n=1 Tax=Sphingomonas radiodurans TaxID=2890321 RepID=UPI001E48DA45|nr:polysaccharide biosynthesis/export family protein [Sphingomonas radiodurans]WBH18087.1 polysaccharide export protein [Sphingomonas radiodurans]
MAVHPKGKPVRARRSLLARALILASTLSIAGCAGMPMAGGAAPAVVAGQDLPTYAYALSGGDRVRVVVFGDATLGGEFLIDGSGFVALPLIGQVDVRGLTAEQLQTRIVTRLADGYVKDPRVAVEVLTTRPFYILGEVNKPGQYPFANGLTVLGAVAQAGGFTYRAKTREVLIKRSGQELERAYQVTASTMVAPGDTIRIKERWF